MLIFLYDTFLFPPYLERTGIPLTFIDFGFVQYKQYKYNRSNTRMLLDEGKKAITYGAVFHLEDPYIYLPILDRFMNCSFSLLGYEHINDFNHRKEVVFTPISFNDFDEFCDLLYSEKQSYTVQAYIGNLNNTKIKNGRRNKNHIHAGYVYLEPFLACWEAHHELQSRLSTSPN